MGLSADRLGHLSALMDTDQPQGLKLDTLDRSFQCCMTRGDPAWCHSR